MAIDPADIFSLLSGGGLSLPPLDGPSAAQQCIDAACSMLTLDESGDDPNSSPDEPPSPALDETNRLRELCRSGNPFPLIARHWPEFLVTDPSEAAHFEGTPGDDLNPCLRLDAWQRDIIRSFFDDAISEIAVKGNTKAGKGTSVSLAVNLWFDVYRECKIVLTSQRQKHAVEVIFGEVSMWRNRMRSPGPGKILSEGLSASKQRYLTIANPQSGEGFSGQHGPRTLFIFDEATAIPSSFYDDAQKQARKIVALANPRTLAGWFRRLYKPCADPNVTQTVNGPFGRRRCLTVSGLDCLNVKARRLEKPLGPPGGIDIDGRHYAHNETIPPPDFEKVRVLIPNQCDYGRFKGICEHPDSRHVAVFGYGRFPTEDPAKQLILASWLERAEEAWLNLRNAGLLPFVECFGLDVARSLDGDQTVLSAGGLKGMAGFHAWKFNDTTFHVAEVLRLAQEVYNIDLTAGRNPIAVDCDGLGAGVADQLRQRGVWVMEFRGNAPSGVDPRAYANLRAEAYATLGRRLNPADQWGADIWPLPPDDDLRAGLMAPEKIYSGDGLRFRITPKNHQPGMPEGELTVKQKLDGRSPDLADSAVYLFHAVREFHSLNAWFAQFSGPLVAYPAAPAKEGENGQAGGANGNGNGNGHQPQQPAAPHANGTHPPEATQADVLLTWIRERYGKYGGGDGAKYIPAAPKSNGNGSGSGNGNGQSSQPTQPPDSEIFEHDVNVGGASGRVSVVDDREDDFTDDDDYGPSGFY